MVDFGCKHKLSTLFWKSWKNKAHRGQRDKLHEAKRFFQIFLGVAWKNKDETGASMEERKSSCRDPSKRGSEGSADMHLQRR